MGNTGAATTEQTEGSSNPLANIDIAGKMGGIGDWAKNNPGKLMGIVGALWGFSQGGAGEGVKKGVLMMIVGAVFGPMLMRFAGIGQGEAEAEAAAVGDNHSKSPAIEKKPVTNVADVAQNTVVKEAAKDVGAPAQNVADETAFLPGVGGGLNQVEGAVAK